MQLMFSARGYDFYRDPFDSTWQCVKAGDPAPRVGAYYDVKALARLKGVPERELPL